MRKPMPEKYPKGMAELVSRLAPLDKALLYAGEGPAEGFSPEQQKELHAGPRADRQASRTPIRTTRAAPARPRAR